MPFTIQPIIIFLWKGGKIPLRDDYEQILESQKVRLFSYPVSQELIDDILENELKDFDFPVKPAYNPRIKANGRTIILLYRWGDFKGIKAIEIGRQDSVSRDFLIDTLLHEYYEAEIAMNVDKSEAYKKISMTEKKRHAWIDKQIAKFFEGRVENGLE